MTFSAVIFDCDGVLVNSESIGIEVERQFLSTVGLNYTIADISSLYRGLSDCDFLAQIERTLIIETGNLLPRDFLLDLNRAKQAAYLTNLRAMPGVLEFIDGVDVPMAVASSSVPSILRSKLRATGLLHKLDPNIFSVSMVKSGKPAPDLFKLAASKLGCDTKGCLVIEDSIAGVQAGIAAGMTVWGFVGDGCEQEFAETLMQSGASQTFGNFYDLLRAFRSVENGISVPPL